MLSLVGIQGPGWLASRDWALPALIIMSLWGVGGGMIIYLAGLQGIPTTLYEAAQIDGASGWQQLRHITLPMITPVIFYNLVIGIIGTFQYFTEVYVLTSTASGGRAARPMPPCSTTSTCTTTPSATRTWAMPRRWPGCCS